MGKPGAHEIYLIVMAGVLAAVVIVYNALVTPQVGGVGALYTNYGSLPSVSSSWQDSSVSREASDAPVSDESDAVPVGAASDTDLPGESAAGSSRAGSSGNNASSASSAGAPSSAPSSTSASSVQSASSQAAGKVNINTDPQERLETLPGIGPKKADSIIRYREANGPFKSVDELVLVSGIGEQTLEKLRPYVTI